MYSNPLPSCLLTLTVAVAVGSAFGQAEGVGELAPYAEDGDELAAGEQHHVQAYPNHTLVVPPGGDALPATNFAYASARRLALQSITVNRWPLASHLFLMAAVV